MALIDEENSYEGYLEKHGNNPVSRIRGKKKTWCYLLGSHLYCHLENKTSSITSTIDLTQAQMIKAVPSDKTKTQFEINTIFKSYIFTAPTQEECQIWIKRLQKAMTGDSQIRHSGSTRSTNSNSSMSSAIQDDSQISGPESNSSCQSVHLSDGYSEVNDFVVELRPKSSTSVAAESSHYQSITLEDDVFRKSNSEKNKAELCSSQAPEEESPVEYSKVIPKNKRPGTKASLESGIQGNENSGANENSKELTESNNRRSGANLHQNNEKDFRISKSRQDTSSDSEGESIDDIHSFIPETFPVIPTLQNSITPDDQSPIRELQKFLINNKLDRLSSTLLDHSSDPIQDLKTYIDSITLDET